MSAILNKSSGFSYEAEITPMPNMQGKYTLAMRSIWEQSKGTAASTTVMKITTDGNGLSELRAHIEDHLTAEIVDIQYDKNEERIKLRNCEFAFRCTRTWESLKVLPYDSTVRHCDDCDKNVYFCADDKALNEAIRMNRCVAVETEGSDNPPMLLGALKPRNWTPPESP